MRTKPFFSMILIALLTISLAACNAMLERAENSEIVSGSGNVVTETREVSGFTAVTLQGFGEVIIDQNGSESLTITTDENFMPYLETEVRGDTLFIRTQEDVIFTDIAKLTFLIEAASLDSVELSGAGSMTISNLDTDRWQATLPGAGSITVSGQATAQTVELSGAGSYDAAGLESQEATIHSSGAGSAIVRASDNLDVTIDGLGSVEYIGDPQVTQEINGVGSVRQRP
ncbi:MAG: head GIN domain-containing protein [Chloroflexota bacterium]